MTAPMLALIAVLLTAWAAWVYPGLDAVLLFILPGIHWLGAVPLFVFGAGSPFRR